MKNNDDQIRALRFTPRWDAIDNKWAIIQVMAWGQTGDKRLPDPILTKIYDTI